MTNTKKIILFNAPPGAGKDHAAQYIVKNYAGACLDKFARVLKERTHALYGFPERSWSYYENCKDEPHNDFMGITPRQAYINVSEKYFKPMHGEKVFGEILARELDKYEWNLLVISDSGFKPEAEVLIDKYGSNNITLVRIHREGHTFDGDSRSYIELPVETIDMWNLGNIDFTIHLNDIVYGILNRDKLDIPRFIFPPSIEPFDIPVEQKADYTTEGQDYIFEDIVKDRPWYKKLWARLVD